MKKVNLLWNSLGTNHINACERGGMMKAKDYLMQVEKLDLIIHNKMIEVDQWKAIATGTTASSSDGERVQSSGSQQKMADAVHKYIEIEEEINSYIDNLIDTKKEIISTIEMLPAIEYDLLHKMYIQYMNIDEVAEALNKTYSWATTVHGRALKHVQDILNARNSVTVCDSL